MHSVFLRPLRMLGNPANRSQVRRHRFVPVAAMAVTAAGLLASTAGIGGCPGPTADCSTTDPVSCIALSLIADGFVAPVGVVAPGDGSGRLMVVDQNGRIHVIDAIGQTLPQPFLDVTDRMIPVGVAGGSLYDERGLLGLAFHPSFADNGLFYVYYTIPKADGDPDTFHARNRVSELRVSNDNADVADPASERVLLEIPSPQSNHNGGQLAFGPDGYLYIASGDGGAGGDAGNGHNPDIGNGQDKMTLLGKILRIDVDLGDPYGVPTTNPFVSDANALPEIYALGLRNPWRFSFDPQGRLFVGDVGQNLFEEVSIVPAGGNCGWRIREGLHCFGSDENCPTVDADGNPLIDPILEYPHSSAAQPFGISVIGGFVYRGTAIANLQGDYVFGDWSAGFISADGSLLAASEQADGTWVVRELAVDQHSGGRIGRFITSFGEDEDGEICICTSQNFGPTGNTGAIYRMVPIPQAAP